MTPSSSIIESTNSIMKSHSTRIFRSPHRVQGFRDTCTSCISQKIINILFLCFRKRACKPSFPESFGDGSCGLGLLFWAAKLFFLESHRSGLSGSALWWKKQHSPLPHPHLPTLPTLDPQESCGPAISRQWGLPEIVAINLFLPISVDWVWPRLFPSQSTLSKNFLKPYVYFMGNFTRLFLIHFQLKAQNTGFVRVLWWFRILLVHSFCPPKCP